MLTIRRGMSHSRCQSISANDAKSGLGVSDGTVGARVGPGWGRIRNTIIRAELPLSFRHCLPGKGSYTAVPMARVRGGPVAAEPCVQLELQRDDEHWRCRRPYVSGRNRHIEHAGIGETEECPGLARVRPALGAGKLHDDAEKVAGVLIGGGVG